MAQSRHYGAKRDRPDRRDLIMPRFEARDIPTDPEVDLSKYMRFSVYKQLHLESCTANAVCAAYCFDLKRQELPDFNPSRLFLYYNTREIDNVVDENSGVSLRDTVKALKSQGVCPEKSWPYDPPKFKIKPSDRCYQEAKGNIVSKYERIKDFWDRNQLRACLKAGNPFVFGFKVYPSFHDPEVSAFGVMKMPSQRELDGNPEGGHAVLAVGYNDEKKVVKVLNSWGPCWGSDGYFYMPYDYITDANLCLDFWKIEFVQETKQLGSYPGSLSKRQSGNEATKQLPAGCTHRSRSKLCTLL